MTDLNRRGFLKGTVGSFLAASMMAGQGSAAPQLPKATDTRTIGNTGLTCSYLGFGTGVRGRGKGITDQTMKLSGQQYVELLESAYNKGITYFDMADQYGVHCYMREALKRSIPRDKVMLLTKIRSRDAEGARNDIETVRKELDCDCIDVLLMHGLDAGNENWPETLKPVMDVFSEAKAKGRIRAHGLSCHNLQVLERVADTEWADVVLARINPFGTRMDGPPSKVMPVIKRIHDTGKAVLGMKVLGEGDPKVLERMNESFKFIGESGAVDAMAIGFMNTEEIEDAMTRIEAVAVT